jgi:hypothetical protein
LAEPPAGRSGGYQIARLTCSPVSFRRREASPKKSA